MTVSGRRPALWFAIFVVFIDALGMSIIIPILPDLLEELTGRTIAETAFIGGVMTAVYALNQFLFGPIIGALSDRYGRRPVILLSLGALTIDYILMAVSWTVWILFIGRFLAGFAGASYTVAAAYIADVSDRNKRSENFGLIGAAFGLGFVIGPALGGMVGAEFGTRAPLWLSAGLCFGGVLFGLFVLPESLRDENRRSFSLRNANPFSSLLRAFSLPGLGMFLAAYVLITLADFTYPAIWAYWSKEVFAWDARMIGFSLAVYGVFTALVQGGLIRAVIPRLGEPRTIWLGLSFAVASFFMIGTATTSWMVFAIIPISSISHLLGAALTGMMTREVSDSEQGELQGILGAIGAVTSVVSAIVMTWIFLKTGNEQAAIYMPGAPFLLAGTLTLIAALPLWVALSRVRARSRAVGGGQASG